MNSAYIWRTVCPRVFKLSGTSWCVGYIPGRGKWFALSVRLDRYILAPTKEEAMVSAEYAQECDDRGWEIPGWRIATPFQGMRKLDSGMRFPITSGGRNLARRIAEHRNGRTSEVHSKRNQLRGMETDNR